MPLTPPASRFRSAAHASCSLSHTIIESRRRCQDISWLFLEDREAGRISGGGGRFERRAGKGKAWEGPIRGSLYLCAFATLAGFIDSVWGGLTASKNDEKGEAREEDKCLMQPVGKGMKGILSAQFSQQVQGKRASREGKHRRKALKDGRA